MKIMGKSKEGRKRDHLEKQPAHHKFVSSFVLHLRTPSKEVEVPPYQHRRNGSDNQVEWRLLSMMNEMME